MVILLVVLVFGLLLVAALAGIYLQFRKSQARTEALLQLAPSLELTPVQPEALVRGEQPGEADVWDAAGTALGLTRNTRGSVSNLFHGRRDGRDVWLFDFADTRTPGSSDTRQATVVSVEARGPLPPLDHLQGGPGQCVGAGDRLVCHSALAADGRLPVGDVPALVEQALGAARLLGV